MALKDYAHWNEDAAYMWWQEEGRFSEDDLRDDPYDDYDHHQWYEPDQEEEVECDGVGHPDELVTRTEQQVGEAVAVGRWTCTGCGALCREEIMHTTHNRRGIYLGWSEGFYPDGHGWGDNMRWVVQL